MSTSDPLYHGPTDDRDVVVIPDWLKWLIGFFVLLWTLGAVGGIWFLVERAQAPCDVNYVEVPGSPGTFQVNCDD
jgi:hypothetical protein